MDPTTHGDQPKAPPAAPDALERLLEAERALARRLAGAREEATRRVEQARADAAAREGELENEVARAVAALEADTEASLRDAVAAIADSAAAERRRLDGIDAARIHELAAFVVRCVMAGAVV